MFTFWFFVFAVTVDVQLGAERLLNLHLNNAFMLSGITFSLCDESLTCLFLFLGSDDQTPADGRIQAICRVCEAPCDWAVEGDQAERQIHVRQRGESICEAIQGKRTYIEEQLLYLIHSIQTVICSRPCQLFAVFISSCRFSCLTSRLFSCLLQEEDFQEMVRTSELMENQYSHLFDTVIVNDELSAAFSKLRMMLRTVETETHWLPVSWTHSWQWKKDQNIQVHYRSVAGDGAGRGTMVET